MVTMIIRRTIIGILVIKIFGRYFGLKIYICWKRKRDLNWKGLGFVTLLLKVSFVFQYARLSREEKQKQKKEVCSPNFVVHGHNAPRKMYPWYQRIDELEDNSIYILCYFMNMQNGYQFFFFFNFQNWIGVLEHFEEQITKETNAKARSEG